MAESINIHKAGQYISVACSEMKMWEEIGKKVPWPKEKCPVRQKQ